MTCIFAFERENRRRDFLSSSNGGGTFATFSYDSSGNVVAVAYSSNGGGTFATFSYDSSGNVVAVAYSANGGGTVATYYYLRNAQEDSVENIDSVDDIIV